MIYSSKPSCFFIGWGWGGRSSRTRIVLNGNTAFAESLVPLENFRSTYCLTSKGLLNHIANLCTNCPKLSKFMQYSMHIHCSFKFGIIKIKTRMCICLLLNVYLMLYIPEENLTDIDSQLTNCNAITLFTISRLYCILKISSGTFRSAHVFKHSLSIAIYNFLCNRLWINYQFWPNLEKFGN